MWFFLSLYFALATAVGMSIAKHVLKTTDVLVYIAFTGLLAIIFMGIYILFQPLPAVDMVFFLAVCGAALINVAASIFSFYAIKIAPISLLAPFSSFNPVFAMLFGFFLLGERIDGFKFFGVALIVIGAYLLQVMDIKEGFLAPLMAIIRDRGVQLTFISNMLWGLTPVFEKKAIMHTNPANSLVAAFVELVILISILFPTMLVRSKNPFDQFKRNIWWYIVPAPFAALAAWSAFTAYSLTNIAYATAIFKLSAIFMILFGAIFFKERRIGERLLGGVVMLLGTVLLVL